MKDFNWADYSLARINLVASGRGNCGEILPKATDETIIKFRESLAGCLDEDDRQMLGIYDKLVDCPVNTLGFEMRNYYKNNGHSPIEPTGTFPVRYIMIHDAHHVLINASTSEQGELNVLAFECGMIKHGSSSESIIPLLAQAKAFPDCDIVEIAKYWEMGCNAKFGLLEQWDLAQWIDKPVQEIKQTYAVKQPLQK
jgi:hypothetical protein